MSESRSVSTIRSKIKRLEYALKLLEEQELKDTGEIQRMLFLDPIYGIKKEEPPTTMATTSEANLKPLTMTANHWPWRSKTSAVWLSQQIPKKHNYRLMFCSTILPLAELMSLRPDLVKIPKYVYYRRERQETVQMFYRIVKRLKSVSSEFKVQLFGQMFDCQPEIFLGLIQAYNSDNNLGLGFKQSDFQLYNVMKNFGVVVPTVSHNFFSVTGMEAIYRGYSPKQDKALRRVLRDDVPDMYGMLADELSDTLTDLCRRNAASTLIYDFHEGARRFNTTNGFTEDIPPLALEQPNHNFAQALILVLLCFEAMRVDSSPSDLEIFANYDT